MSADDVLAALDGGLQRTREVSLHLPPEALCWRCVAVPATTPVDLCAACTADLTGTGPAVEPSRARYESMYAPGDDSGRVRPWIEREPPNLQALTEAISAAAAEVIAGLRPVLDCLEEVARVYAGLVEALPPKTRPRPRRRPQDCPIHGGAPAGLCRAPAPANIDVSANDTLR